jgi:hypothetical protein
MRDKHQFCYSCQQTDTTERNDLVSHNTKDSSLRFGCESSTEDVHDDNKLEVDTRTQVGVSNVVNILIDIRHNIMIKNVLKRRKESGTYLSTDSGHRWRVQMIMKNDK